MEIVGLLVLMFGAGLFVLVYGMWLKAKRLERRTTLYERALDKGVDPRTLKLDLDEQEAGDPAGNLKAGIILLATALAMVLGMWASTVLSGAYSRLGFALVPALIGLALLFIHYTVPRRNKPTKPQEE